MPEKQAIDKEYLIASLKDFDDKILSKKYATGVVYEPQVGKVTTTTVNDNANVSIDLDKEKNFANFNFSIPKGKDGNVDEALEKMKETINAGYQRILDEDIAYINASVVLDTSPTPSDLKLKFNINNNLFISNHGFDIDDDGYIVLKAGHVYNIHPCIMIKQADADVEYHIINKDGALISNSGNCWAESGVYSDCIFPITYAPEKDTPIVIEMSENVPLYQYSISIHELKTPVYTNVELDRYIEHTNNAPEDTPVGHIISYMGKKAPAHYLICNGTEYGITDYPYLVDHFIEEFGTSNYFGGDGETTFAVPDLRGEFLRGTGTNGHTGQGNGGDVGTHQNATYIPYMSKDSANSLFNILSNKTNDISSAYDYIRTAQSNNVKNSITYKEYNTGIQDYAGTVRPTNTSVLYCIKYEPTYFLKFADANYSKNEYACGIWHNGKTLYEKSIIVKDCFSVEKNKIPTEINNPDSVFIHEGFFVDLDDGCKYPIGYSTAGELIYHVKNDRNYIYFSNDIAIPNAFNFVCKIRYTKNN